MKTMTVDQIRIKNQFYVEMLNYLGMNVTQYAKPPAGKYNLAMSINYNKIYVWFGNAEVEVFLDKKHRQAVIHSVEKEREFSGFLSHNGMTKRMVADRVRSVWRLSDSDSVVITGSKPQYSSFGNLTHFIDGYAVKRNATDLYFLVGYDEYAQFICQLPERAISVEDAHKVLRPKGLKDGSPRQGEFFFQVAEPDELKPVFNGTALENSIHSHMYKKKFRIENGNSHFASFFIKHKEDSYVCGWITDSQKRHKDLFLPTWHKVVRNTEVQSDIFGGYWD